MHEFEMLSPDGEDIFLKPRIGDPYSHLIIKGADHFMAECSFGDLLFNHFAGDGYDLWTGDYLIKRPARVIGRANVAMLEFSIISDNPFSIDWTNVTKGQLPHRQIELYHSLNMDNTTHFPKGRFRTVDFHFYKSILDSYTSDFYLLGKFMEKVHAGQPAQLFDGKQFTSLPMDLILNLMFSDQFNEKLAADHYDSCTHLLLIQLLERISGFNPSTRSHTKMDLENARQAHWLLTTEFEAFHTINTLCKKLNTNPYKLKTAFYFLYNTSIGKYKKSVLMDHARIYLETTDMSMESIADKLGYGSRQSLTTAIRSYFKVIPSHFRRRR